jgi:hypothetical protein
MTKKNTKLASVPGIVWPWREPRVETTRNETSHRRKRSLLESAITLAVGLAFFFFYKRILGMVIIGIGSLVLIGGQLVPPLYYGFRKVGVLLARVVGTGLTWILLLPFFYVVFTCGRFFLLVFRKDPLKRTCPSSQKSYWDKRKPVGDTGWYKRQY